MTSRDMDKIIGELRQMADLERARARKVSQHDAREADLCYARADGIDAATRRMCRILEASDRVQF